MAALGLGTYGAHVFKPQNLAYKEVHFILSISLSCSTDREILFLPLRIEFFIFLIFLILVVSLKVWNTASLYHLVHTAALIAAPITKHPSVVSVLCCTLFSI